MITGDIVELEEWLVIIDFKHCLVSENYSESDEEGETVEISRSKIMFAILDGVMMNLSKRIRASRRMTGLII